MALLTCRLLLRGARGRHVADGPAPADSGADRRRLDADRRATDRRCSTCCTGSPTTTPPGCATPPSSATRPPRGLAVVMPAVGRSSTPNEAHGHAYWDYISEELPRGRGVVLPGLDAAGGHLRGGPVDGRLRRPQARAQPSRAVRRRGQPLRRGRRAQPGQPGSNASSSSSGSSTARFGPGDDLYELVDAVDPATMPPLYISCGTEEDRLMDANTRLVEPAAKRGLDVTTDFRPGVHEWGLWDDVIQDVIAWLPIAGDRAGRDSLASRHEARADRRRRPERLLRRRFAARPGGARVASDIAELRPPLERPAIPKRRTTPTSSPPRTTTSTPASTGPTSPTSSTPGRCTARSAPTARPSTPTSTRSRSTRSSSRASTWRRTPASRARDRRPGLADWLRAHEVEAIDVCGLATDHCVRATALDGAGRVRRPRCCTTSARASRPTPPRPPSPR